MLLDELLDPQTQKPRSNAFWVAFGALAAAQLVALWMLCSHQVRKAEARQVEVQMQQMAMADCLQYIPGSTIASCANRLAASGGAATASMNTSSGRGAMNSAMPVSFSFQ